MFRREILAPILGTAVAIGLVYGLLQTSYVDVYDWFPQILVTLVGLIGASWLAGLRLDLHDKDLINRQASYQSQRETAEQANFNNASKEAILLLVNQETISSLKAGQRILHSFARNSVMEANLVQALLCDHLVDLATVEDKSRDFKVDSRQSALNLLFRSPESSYFAACEDIPRLQNSSWQDLDFTNCDLRQADFSGCDFTDSTIEGTNFNGSDLSQTKWYGLERVGGYVRTTMRNVAFHGSKSSSCTFMNVDFTNAKLSSYNGRTYFKTCTFVNCSFNEADWTGAVFANCSFQKCDFSDTIWDAVRLQDITFELCSGITFEMCKRARLITRPVGLRADLISRLRQINLIDE